MTAAVVRLADKGPSRSNRLTDLGGGQWQIDSSAALAIGLPYFPSSRRDLLSLLDVLSPLVPRAIVTGPVFAGPTGACVWIVRRAWLDAAVEEAEGTSSAVTAILDPAGHVMTYGPRRSAAALTRRRRVWTGALLAVIAAVGLGLWVKPRSVPSTLARPVPASLVPPSQNVTIPTAVPSPIAAEANVAGALQLLGIAGRLPDDVDVLVKTPYGKTLTLRPGDSVIGWRLLSVEANRAVFDHAGQRVELTLPAP